MVLIIGIAGAAILAVKAYNNVKDRDPEWRVTGSSRSGSPPAWC